MSVSEFAQCPLLNALVSLTSIFDENTLRYHVVPMHYCIYHTYQLLWHENKNTCADCMILHVHCNGFLDPRNTHTHRNQPRTFTGTLSGLKPRNANAVEQWNHPVLLIDRPIAGINQLILRSTVEQESIVYHQFPSQNCNKLEMNLLF